MSNVKEIKALIERLANNGKSYAKIRDTLITLDYASNVAEAEKLLESEGIEKTKRAKGLTDEMYDFIAEKERSEEDLRKWIEENGTENTLRWIRSHQKVRELVNRVRAK